MAKKLEGAVFKHFEQLLCGFLWKVLCKVQAETDVPLLDLFSCPSKRPEHEAKLKMGSETTKFPLQVWYKHQPSLCMTLARRGNSPPEVALVCFVYQICFSNSMKMLKSRTEIEDL